jgi:hypothetical protein
VKGNKAYAYRNGKTAERIFDNVINNSPEHCLYITLTQNYTPSVEGIKASWEQMNKAVPRLIRQIKRVKYGAYQYVLEAHENGGCHCHIIYNTGNGALPDNPPTSAIGTGNVPETDLRITESAYLAPLRITDDIANVIKKNWKGGFVMRKVQRDNVANMKRYFLKSVGREGHVETALDRMSKGYSGNGGDKEKRKDIKLLKTLYFSTFYGIKTVGYSRQKQAEGVAVVPALPAGGGEAVQPLPAGASPAVQPITAGGNGAGATPSQVGKCAVPILGRGNTNASGIGVFLPLLLKQILIKSTVLVNLIKSKVYKKRKGALPDNPLPCKKTFTLPRWVTDSPRFDPKCGDVDPNSWLYGVLMEHLALQEPKAVTVHHNPLHRLLKRLLNAFRALINRIRRKKP